MKLKSILTRYRPNPEVRRSSDIVKIALDPLIDERAVHNENVLAQCEAGGYSCWIGGHWRQAGGDSHTGLNEGGESGWTVVVVSEAAIM